MGLIYIVGRYQLWKLLGPAPSVASLYKRLLTCPLFKEQRYI